MRALLFVTTACTVIGLAFWAYHQNYRTQQAIAETEALQRQIAETRARFAVLRAEWAYLNRPDRLMELAEMNFDTLGLLPFRPEQFGRVEQVAYPAEDAPEPIANVVEISEQGESTP
ncbi:cell division protein FtsL [Rhodosalinus sp. FB01]|uniref:cell division protein FtsL n=1 Tax=Rhodosalinus sp. FB01 TaxID=3239194 RepID=UPI00352635DE